MDFVLIGNSIGMDYLCSNLFEFWVGRFIVAVVAGWKDFISLMGLEL